MQPLVGPCHISASCFSVISGVIIYFFFNLVRTDLVWGLNGKCLDALCLFFFNVVKLKNVSNRLCRACGD